MLPILIVHYSYTNFPPLVRSPLVARLYLHAFFWHFGTAFALYWGGLGSLELGMAMQAKTKASEGSYKSK